MDMGFDELNTGLDAFRSAVGLAKNTKDLLPEGPQRDAVMEGLEKAERATQLAKAQIAQTLGFPLCRCTFPPQIMLSEGRRGSGYNRWEDYRCPECGRAT